MLEFKIGVRCRSSGCGRSGSDSMVVVDEFNLVRSAGLHDWPGVILQVRLVLLLFIDAQRALEGDVTGSGNRRSKEDA